MPYYCQLGEIPPKRHSIYQQANGRLYYEELTGSGNGAGATSLLYHIHRPTQVLATHMLQKLEWEPESPRPLRQRHFRTHEMEAPDRAPVVFNDDVAILTWAPAVQNFYRNAQSDEVFFSTMGSGVFETQFGDLAYRRGDFVVVPRGVIYKLRPNPVAQRFLVVESRSSITIPGPYLSRNGQLSPAAPFCERDIRTPSTLTVFDEKGEFPLLVKMDGWLQEVVFDHHPFDVVGWDGYHYPWAFNIHDFEPRIGRFRLPASASLTLTGDGFSIHSMLPGPVEFDKAAVPGGYNQTLSDVDEVIYHAGIEMAGKRGVEFGSLTLHPAGLATGPQPGAAEESIGKRTSDLLALMILTSRSLHVNSEMQRVEEAEYYRSWLA